MNEKKPIEDSLIMTPILSALESVSTEEGEGGAGLVVPAGHALHLQLEVQLQRLGGHQVGQRGVPAEGGGQEGVGLRADVVQKAVSAHTLCNEVTSLLRLQRAQQRGLRRTWELT